MVSIAPFVPADEAGGAAGDRLGGPLCLRVLLLFPDGVPPRSPWLRLLPDPFALFGVSYVALFSGFPYSGRHSEWILNGVSALFIVAALALVARVCRRADPVRRRPGSVAVSGGEAFGRRLHPDRPLAPRGPWSAIGNTTNLAARLQGLTRELDAAIVVDADTHARAGGACADFARRPQVAIRGQRQRRDLFVLPLPAGPR